MTNDKAIMSKTQLMTKFERAWDALQRTIDGSNEEDLTQKTDAAGWSSKDHLAHLAVWGNSVLVMIRDGRPQWEGLGVDKAMFDAAEGYDEENEVIRQQTVDWSLDRVTSHFADIHQELVRVLADMSDDDLARPCSHFVEGGSDVAIVQMLDGDGPNHYDEHREYIELILKG